MQRICQASDQTFEITPEDWEFYKKVSPQIGGKVYEISPPILCPDERQRRRLAWRNERRLYERKCDSCAQQIISLYPADCPYLVFCPACWYGEKTDPMQHGVAFDFSRPFFEQYAELLLKVPVISLYIEHDENSAYTNYSSFNQNCYLIFSSEHNQSCFYCDNVNNSRDVVDCSYVNNSELCYDCVDCSNCYQVFFAQSAHNCNDSSYLFDCRGCKNCCASANLNQREFVFLNKQLTPETYRQHLKHFHEDPAYHREIMTAFEDLRVKAIRKNTIGLQNENVLGDYIYHSKNAVQCFDCDQVEDCRYCTWMMRTKSAMDCYGWGFTGELGYELHSCGSDFYRVILSCACWSNIRDLIYCIHCVNNTTDCFGCVGLRHAQYCILNKQYSKEDYEKLVPQIIEHMQKTGEWGEFFPVELSPFAYNETIAQEYFPLIKTEVLQKGWQWREETNEIPKVERIIPANLLPDSITEVPDDILNWAIECEETKKPFIIQKPELEFYRKMNLSIPRLHPDVRHQKRMAKRNPRKLWSRNCDNCGKPIQTTYAPDRPEKVFCEECYNKAVY